MINSTYPIIHEKMIPLLKTFLDLKKRSPYAVERKYYQDKNLEDLLNKVLQHRPIVFMCGSDKYMLIDKTAGHGGFEEIGKIEDEKKLKLSEYNGYDEMKLAALTSVTCLSAFINDGNRFNSGAVGKGHEPFGVIVGQVGTRFEREQFMEYQDCLVTSQQNTTENGYGATDLQPLSEAGQILTVKQFRTKLNQAWAQFWEVEEGNLPAYDEISPAESDQYIEAGHKKFLNASVYMKRIEIVADILLIEAVQRAMTKEKKAYVHVVGLGLGVWGVGPFQAPLYVRAWLTALRRLPAPSRIHTLDFSWIKPQPLEGVGQDGRCSQTGVRVVFSSRPLHAPVPPETFLVCNYAWDSNSAPGNEFWLGSLSGSGDPAAACSSCVAWLHNWRINPRVAAPHVRVACVASGTLRPVQEFI